MDKVTPADECPPEREERIPLAELMARAKNSSLTDPTWRTDYRS